jgi:hypothetical protein
MSAREKFPATFSVTFDIEQNNRQSLITLAHEKSISWQLTPLPFGHTMPIKRNYLVYRQLQAMSSPGNVLKGGDKYLF